MISLEQPRPLRTPIASLSVTALAKWGSSDCLPTLHVSAKSLTHILLLLYQLSVRALTVLFQSRQLGCADGRLAQFISTRQNPTGRGWGQKRTAASKFIHLSSSLGLQTVPHCRGFCVQGVYGSLMPPDSSGLLPPVHMPRHHVGRPGAPFSWQSVSTVSRQLGAQHLTGPRDEIRRSESGNKEVNVSIARK